MDKAVLKQLVDAVKSGDTRAVKKHLAKDKRLLAQKHKDLTPIFYSTEDNNVEILETLLLYDVNLNQTCTKREKTPLMHAALHNADNVIRALLQYGANLRATDYKLRTALFYACDGDNAYRAAQALVDAGANVNHVGYHDYTPLMHAVVSRSRKVSRLLLDNGAGKW